MHRNEFRNIFLGLGGFHTENTVLSCMGTFLEEVEVDLAFVANEIFGPYIATSVMNGSHYSPCVKRSDKSHREGNWCLHLSAILFFAFDRTDYNRWTPLYYEDFLKLSEVLPELHREFLQGRFVVIQTYVAQWNVIKHEEAQSTKFLQDLCQLNDDREYSLYHEFSEAIIRTDEEAVE